MDVDNQDNPKYSDDDDDDAAARAYASITSQLQAWGGESSKEDTALSSSSLYYEQYYGDVYEGEDEEEEEEKQEERAVEETETSTALSTEVRGGRKKDLVVEEKEDRAEEQEEEQEEEAEEEEVDDEFDFDHQLNTSTRGRHENDETLYEQQQHYRRYYDAFLTFLRRRQNVKKRMELTKQELQLRTSSTTMTTALNSIDYDRHNEELDELQIESDQIELQFLQSSSKLCHDRASDNIIATSKNEPMSSTSYAQQQQTRIVNTSKREGNVWSLLSTLRSLGLDSLFYDDVDESIQARQHNGIRQIVQLVADQVNKYPADVVRDLFAFQPPSSSSSPNITHEEEQEQLMIQNAILALKRRKFILEWIELCNEQELSITTEGGGRSITGIMSSSKKERNVMWPMTLRTLQNQQSIFGRRTATSSGKVTTMDIDEPLRLLLSSKSSSAGGAVIQPSPLYGTDESEDVELLRICLLLYKAGRLDDAMDLCKRYGQPWRCCSWGGGTLYGRGVVKDVGGDEASATGITEVVVGNPTRALWKRQCWNLGRTLSEKISSSSSASSLSSIHYESAIYALLSDDINSALANPTLRTWEDGLYIYLSATLNRIIDETLHCHNSLRRTIAHIFPYRGMNNESEEEEIDQLNCTAALVDMNEGDIFKALSSSVYDQVRAEAQDVYRSAMAAFVVGKDSILRYIMKVTDKFVPQSKDENHRDDYNTDDTNLLRFMTHLLLYIDMVDPIFLSVLGAFPDETANEMETDYHPTSVKDGMLLLYVQHLASYRTLWHMVAMYTSLLPTPILIDSYSSFLTRVEDDAERRMVLRQGREYFAKGSDLVILRRVVRMMLSEEEEDEEDVEGRRRVVRTLRSFPVPGGKEGSTITIRPNDNITKSELRKMRSVHWLCYHPEHAGDALICANMLIRQFLLAAYSTNEGGGEEDGGGVRRSAMRDEANAKLHSAKLFMEQFLPEDLVDIALEGAMKTEEGSDSHDDDDEGMEEKHEEKSTSSLEEGNLSLMEVEDAAAENGALLAFFNAHTAYENWSEVIASTSPYVDDVSSSLGHRKPVETLAARRGKDAFKSSRDEIASSVERRAFMHQKRDLARVIIESADDARENLLHVLTYPGGWLSRDVDLEAISSDDEESKRRSNELSILRSVCLPGAVFLLHSVLDRTADWMNSFFQDAVNTFGTDGSDWMSRLLGGVDNDDAGEDVISSPLTPENWHRCALSLADTVARDEHGLHDAFETDDLKRFMNLMAESSVKILRCSQGN